MNLGAGAKTIMSSLRSRFNDNGVNGVALHVNGSNPSPGRTSDVLQVTTNRHPATRSNRKPIRISIWNVRTLFKKGLLDNVLREMGRLDIGVLGLYEVRWKEAGTFRKNDSTVIYSGGNKHQRGVGMILYKQTSKSLLWHWALSDRVILVKIKGNPFNISIIQAYAPTSDADDEIDSFFFNETLDKAYNQYKSTEVKIVMGDINAKVGKGKVGSIVGPFGLGDRNDRGEKFIDWCARNHQVITGTWFKHHPRRFYTWTRPGDRTRNQIDYITIIVFVTL
ncbi:craniofacial development protein 2-like [Penaeus vannamei]|uniref:craniofacial development protein 2-like n=1 Tax=Penaeus vannamei TaxID=6689 RepID=UPI00387F83AD